MVIFSYWIDMFFSLEGYWWGYFLFVARLGDYGVGIFGGIFGKGF